MAILHLRFSCHLFVFMASDVVLRSQPDTVDSPSTQKVSVPSHTARGQTFNGCVQRKYYGRKNMIWIEVFRYQSHVHHAVFSGTGFLRCRLIINRHVISGLRHWTLCVVCVCVCERKREKQRAGWCIPSWTILTVDQSEFNSCERGAPSLISVQLQRAVILVCLNESSRLCVCVRPCVW